MGLMYCNRHGCNNILCNLYSDIYGYICGECFAEMKESGLSVAEFMDTNRYPNKRRDYDYDKVFERLRHEEGW